MSDFCRGFSSSFGFYKLGLLFAGFAEFLCWFLMVGFFMVALLKYFAYLNERLMK